ncbi:MAG: tetratricopeptide repeat protein [Candidatus Firestonebacteria bacterium]
MKHGFGINNLFLTMKKKCIFYANMVIKINNKILYKKYNIILLGGMFLLLWLLFSFKTLCAQSSSEIEEMQKLNNGGEILYNSSDFYGAAKKWEDGLKIARETKNTQAISTFVGNLGVVYMNLGDYQKAISYYEEALKIKREIGDKKGIGNNLTNLGVVSYNLGDYQKAISYYEEALKIDKEIGDKKGIGSDLTNLGVVYMNLGDYQKAISYYEEALKIKREIGDKKGIGNNLTNLGVVSDDLGDYQKAISYYEEALKIKREIGDKKGIGDNLTNLGVVYMNLGDYQKAISYYEEALKIDKEIGDKKGIGNNLTNLGVVYINLGDYQKAISYYEEALKIYREIGVPTEQVEANIADIYLETGEIEKAEKEYLRLGNQIRLSRLYLIKKNYSKAIEYLDMALKDEIKRRNATFLFAEYCGLGEGQFGLKNYKKAKENYDKAITLTEEQREGLGEGEKSKFFSANIMGFPRTQPYEGMIRSLIALNQKDDAFFYSENLKARVLAEAIAKGYKETKKVANIPSNLTNEEENYIIKIRGLRKEMEVLYRNNAMDIYAEKEKELKVVKAKQDEFISKLRQSYPEYTSVNYPQPISPKDINLRKDEVLIEAEITENKTYLFLLKGKDKTISVREVAITRKELKELVLKYRGYFEKIEKYSDLAKYDAKVGKKLYTLLFGDVLKDMAGGSTLIIVPDEILGILPFEALVTDLPAKEKLGEGKYGSFPLGVKYLGDRYTVMYIQSATFLTLARSLKKDVSKEEKAVVICDPIFSVSDRRLKGDVKVAMKEEEMNMMGAIARWKKMGVAGVKDKGGSKPSSEADLKEDIFPRLEKTLEIGKGVRNLFGNNAMVLAGLSAKEEEVVKLPFSNYRYVTFATHGILDSTIPYIKEPALVLSQVGNSEEYDGFLTMSEVMGLKIPARVVMLTACETGVGKDVRGEGVMGMGRAFQFAGCKDVLVSLWSVAEDSTVDFSMNFLKCVKEGKDSKDAMKMARDEIRRKGYEHPFYWASFILIGN